VPPRILLDKTSTDVVVREGTEVTLECSATGYPQPYVAWRREDGKAINYNGELGEEMNLVDGNVFQIRKVSRLHMGAYLCIASNGVIPSVSHKIMVTVHFPPMLTIPNQLEGAYISQTVELHCHTEAFPASLNYWTNEKGDMIITGDDYEDSRLTNGYSCHMTLKIRTVMPNSFGSYRCVAVNALGETDGFIKVYGR
ncbi:hypothetical protein WDU94_005218, partial [Cyamophila willieti]